MLPWTEKYYHDMAALIDSRFKEWEDEPQTDPQFLHIPQDNIKLLLKDWSKAIECTVSSRVLVDGCEIATCIRQKLIDCGANRYKKARRPELYRDIIGMEHQSEQKVVWLNEDK